MKKECAEQIAALKAEYDRELKNLHNKYNQGVAKLQSSHENVMKDTCKELEVEIENLRKELKKCKEKVAQLEKENADLKKKLADVPKEVREIDGALSLSTYHDFPTRLRRTIRSRRCAYAGTLSWRFCRRL